MAVLKELIFNSFYFEGGCGGSWKELIFNKLIHLG